MKKGIHPEVYPVLVVFTNGEQREMPSTFGKPNETVKIHLESDRFNHPAWNPGLRVSGKRNSRASRFVSKFGDL